MQLQKAPMVYNLVLDTKEMALVLKGLAMLAGLDVKGSGERTKDEKELASALNLALLKQRHALLVNEVQRTGSMIEKAQAQEVSDEEV